MYFELWFENTKGIRPESIRPLKLKQLELSNTLNDVAIIDSLRAMDPAVQRLLNDKLYDKRKQGALEFVLARSS